jgi:hypothetical protein
LVTSPFVKVNAVAIGITVHADAGIFRLDACGRRDRFRSALRSSSKRTGRRNGVRGTSGNGAPPSLKKKIIEAQFLSTFLIAFPQHSPVYKNSHPAPSLALAWDGVPNPSEPADTRSHAIQAVY